MSRVRVCRADEVVSDRGLAVKAGGEPLAIFRIGERVFAVRDLCPHAGSPLSAGAAYPDDDGKPVVVCPVHYWLFSLEDGSCPYHPGMQAVVYEAGVSDGEVWVELPEAAVQGK